MLARINKNYLPAYWNDFFNDEFLSGFNNTGRNETSPAVNIIEDEKEFRIELAVPGLSRKDLKIEVENDLLTVSADQKIKKVEKGTAFRRKEFGHYTFSKSFQLPEMIDQDRIKAHHEAGILSIELPKREEEVQKATRQIEVQ